jgi:hypothetical protein
MVGITEFSASSGSALPLVAGGAGLALAGLLGAWRRRGSVRSWPVGGTSQHSHAAELRNSDGGAANRRGPGRTTWGLLLILVILPSGGQAQAADGPVLGATLEGGDLVLSWTPPDGAVRLILIQSCPDDPYCTTPQPLDLLSATATGYRVDGGVPEPGHVAVWRVGFWIGKRLTLSNTVAAVSYALE